jgi:hypothetical protein
MTARTVSETSTCPGSRVLVPIPTWMPAPPCSRLAPPMTFWIAMAHVTAVRADSNETMNESPWVLTTWPR